MVREPEFVIPATDADQDWEPVFRPVSVVEYVPGAVTERLVDLPATVIETLPLPDPFTVTLTVALPPPEDDTEDEMPVIFPAAGFFCAGALGFGALGAGAFAAGFFGAAWVPAGFGLAGAFGVAGAFAGGATCSVAAFSAARLASSAFTHAAFDS